VAQRVLWLSLVSGSAAAVAELAVAQRVLWLSLVSGSAAAVAELGEWLSGCCG